MPKGVQRSNREKRKPKKPVPLAAPGKSAPAKPARAPWK